MAPLRPTLKELALWIAGAAIAAASWLVPKKRGLAAFFPTFEPNAFSGNLRNIFLAVSQPPETRDALWLTRGEGARVEVIARGRNAARYAIFPLWAVLRAETVFIDALAPLLCGGRFRIIQVWHGTGFKKIALMNMHRRGLRRARHRRQYQSYALIIASSEDDRERKIACFANSNVLIAGSPRNDDLLDLKGAGDLKSRLGLEGFTAVIAYCPTYRDVTNGAPFTDAFWSRLNSHLAERSAVFVIKRHPSDANLSPPVGLSHVRDLSEQVTDVMALLKVADVLVSDYSSIVTDYSLLGRPIIFYVYDMADYAKADRSLYYDLKSTLPGPFCTTQHELLERLFDLSWAGTPEYAERYGRFCKQFNAYADAGSARRVLAGVFPNEAARP